MAHLNDTVRPIPKLSWVIPALVLISFAISSIAFPANPAHLLGTLSQSVNSFDDSILSFLNRFARRSWTLDALFCFIDSNPLATAPIFMAFWWIWFKKGEDQSRNRELLLHGIIVSFLTWIVIRPLAFLLPFRERPLHNPTLHFQLPYGMEPNRLIGWSSFPSDHAIEWFLLVTTLMFVSRRLGVFLYVYVSLTLCVARIYLGIHYPTDVLVGALIGIAVAFSSRFPTFRKAVTYEALRWLDRAPNSFYAFFFIITQQLMEGFASLHELKALLVAILKALLKLI